jgi:hypothetical protein
LVGNRKRSKIKYMSFGRSALNFGRDMVRVFVPGPEQAKQQEPAKMKSKEFWGKPFITRKDLYKRLGKKNQKVFFGADNERIKLVAEKRIKQVDRLFGKKKRLNPEEARVRTRLILRENNLARQRGGLPSEINETREADKLMKIIGVGPKPDTEGIGSTIRSGIKDMGVMIGRVAMGKDPTIKNTPDLNASNINQDTPEIKK